MTKDFILKTDVFFEKIPDILINHKWKVWLSFIIITMIFACGVAKVEMDMSLESYFQQGEPVKEAYDHFRVLFGGDESGYIVYKAKDGDLFSDRSLKAVQRIQEDLLNYRMNLEENETSPLDHMREVKTVLNIKFLESKENTLLSRNLIGDKLPVNHRERETIRQKALDHPDYPLTYYSKDSAFGGILIRTDFNAELIYEGEGPEESVVKKENSTIKFDYEEIEFDDEIENLSDVGIVNDTKDPKFKVIGIDEYGPFSKAVKEIIETPENLSALEFNYVGNPFIIPLIHEDLMKEMGMIVVGLFVLMFFMLLIIFRSLSAVLWPLIVIAATLIWVMGFIGFINVKMSTMILILVFMILAIGIADAVHILSGYKLFREEGYEHRNALKAVYKKSGLACFLTSITTSIGLMSMLLVSIVPIKIFGVCASVGVQLAFIFTIVMLPVMLDLWSPYSKKKLIKKNKANIAQRILLKVDDIGIKYNKAILIAFAAITVILLTGVVKVKVDYDFVGIYEEGHPIRVVSEVVDKYLGGTGNMTVVIDTGKIDGMHNPDLLKAVDKIQKYVKAKHSDVVNSTSLANIVKNSYKSLNNDSDDYFIIPDDQRVIKQVLFMFNNSNQKDRRLVVTDDYKVGNISLNVKNYTSQEAEDFIDDVESRLAKEMEPLKTVFPDMKIIVTGQLALLAKLMNYISWAQVKSFGATLAVISFLLLILLGSRKIGMIAILPNLFPIFTIFGIMGYFGIVIDTDTLLVAPIIIGIAVDDTIHFLTHYRLEFKKTRDINQAVVNTIHEVGQAIMFTSVILSSGFLIFIFSSHTGFQNFGILSAIAIMTALCTDLFLLPAMLTFFAPKTKNVEFKVEFKNVNPALTQ